MSEQRAITAALHLRPNRAHGWEIQEEGKLSVLTLGPYHPLVAQIARMARMWAVPFVLHRKDGNVFLRWTPR